MYDLVHSSSFIDFPFPGPEKKYHDSNGTAHLLDYHDGLPHFILICYLTANDFIFFLHMTYGESLTYCTVLQKKKKKKG
jgi:hypothetical protein